MPNRPRPPSRHAGKTKAQLIEELNHLEEALDAMPEAFAAFDADDNLAHYNTAYQELFPSLAGSLKPGLPYREMLRIQLNAITLQAAVGREEEWIEERIKRRRNPGAPSEQLFSDGRVMQLEQFNTASGGSVDIRRDVTELRRTQSNERKQQNELQALMNAVPMPMFVKDRDGKYLSCNPSYERFMGMSEAELVGKRLSEIIDDDRASVHENADAALFASNGSDVYELTAVTGRGIPREVIFYKTVFGGGGEDVPPRMVCVLIDITEIRVAEKTLRQSEERWSAIFQKSPNAMSISDPHTQKILAVNDAWCAAWGHAREEAVGKRTSDLGLLKDGEARRPFYASMTEQGSVDSFEITFVTKDGRERITQISAQTVMLDGVERILSVVEDVTDRKLAEQALGQSEERWSSLFEKGPNGMVLYDLNSRKILAVNDAWCSDWGFERDQVVGKETSELNVLQDDGVRDELYRLLNKQGFVEKYEANYLVRDGKARIAQITGRKIILDGADCILSMVVDITEPRLAEQALANSEAQFRDLIEGSIQGIIVHIDFRLAFANDTAASMFGYDDPNDLLRVSTYENLIAQSDRQRLRKYNDERLKGRYPPDTYEFQGLRKDGSTIWVENRATLIDWQGQRAVQSVTVDITERKLAQQALAESERQFRNLIEGSAQGITVIIGSRIAFANNMAAEIFGYGSPNELMTSASNMDLVAPRDRDRIKNYAEKRKAGGNPPRLYDFAGMRKDGTTVWLENRTTLITWRGEKAILIFTIDITARKLAQQALAESEQQFRNLIEGSLQGIAVYINQRIAFANQSAAEIFGYDGADDSMTGISYLDLIVPEERARIQNISEMRRAGKSPANVYEYKGLRKDGTIVWLENRATTINWQGESATLIFTADITERKSAAAAIERFVEALEFAPQAIALWDDERRLIHANEQYRKVLGPTGKILVPGVGQTEILHEMAYNGVIDGSKGREKEWFDERLAELEQPYSSGRFLGLGRWHQRTTQHLPDGGMIIQIEDIHDLITAEEQLRQSQKMEAVGQLTGGIAHDFNNLLAVTLGHLELVADGLPRNADSQPLLEKAIAATNRGAELVHRLLAFSSIQALSPETLDLNQRLRHTVEMLHRVLDESIEIKIVEAPDPCFCQIDPGQLETALLNLAINARDAMASGGVLTIAVSRTELEQDEGEILAGNYVTLTITDTGSGMSKSVLEHVFEPFYTTKEQGKGTGLGLSMVYGFVKQSSGHITLQSEPGVGTTFTIYLPRFDDPGKVRNSDAAPQAVVKTNECILVVEDELDLLEMASQLLQSLGYRVLQANDGATALTILASEEKVDLLLSDVVLPKGTSGPDIAARALDLQPHIKVLFMSGYNDHPALNSNTTNPQPSLIAKPFRKAQLAAEVRAILDHAN